MKHRGWDEALWNLARGALGTRALGIASDLRIADALDAGPRSVDDLAQEAGADPDVLHRILRALASDGVFAEESRGVFRNNETSELLRESGWRDFGHLFGGPWHRAAGELEAQAAESTFPRVYGSEFWTWLEEHPEERAAFDRAMTQGTEGRVELLAARDWRGDETVVDIGGGNGALLLELVRRVPGIRGVVFDLPETVRDEHALGERITFVEGDFFREVPTGDVYVLSTILHDWDDDHAARILESIRAAAPDHARLLVLDAVIPPGNDPNGAKWLDLLMLVLFGGRERDEEQWRALLARSGFEPLRIEERLIEARCL